MFSIFGYRTVYHPDHDPILPMEGKRPPTLSFFYVTIFLADF